MTNQKTDLDIILQEWDNVLQENDKIIESLVENTDRTSDEVTTRV